MLKSGYLNSPKFLLQSIFPEDWKLPNRPSRNPWAAPACWRLKKYSQNISFDWAFPYTFFRCFFFCHHQGKDPGLEGHLVSVWRFLHYIDVAQQLIAFTNGLGFQKASNSPTCWPDGKLAVTLLYPGNNPLFMKLLSTLYSGFPLTPSAYSPTDQLLTKQWGCDQESTIRVQMKGVVCIYLDSARLAIITCSSQWRAFLCNCKTN